MARPVTTPDLTGRRFGRLLVLSRGEPDAKRRTRYLVECDCGTRKIVFANHLFRGATKSCGCYRFDAVTTHGDTRNGKPSPEFNAWFNMIQRCENPNHAAFKYYGERGISVCKQWRESFAAFLADVGRRPSPKHSIDRWPDNDGNYEPGNVRWATRAEQLANRRPYRKRK